MRGQRLFIRPIEEGDQVALVDFLRAERGPSPPPACGLLAKLVGNLVGVVEIRITPAEIRVADIVVARDLRRKRIGRLMLEELSRLAAKLDRQRLVVEQAGDAQEFFRRTGFQRKGDQWVRQVR